MPRHKHDHEAAERAVTLGWPGIEPVVTELLVWLQDYNWPVSRPLAPLLAAVGEPLVPYLEEILLGDDAIWTYWVIQCVVADSVPAVTERLRPILERMATAPTGNEIAEEVDEAARAALLRA